MFKFGMSIALLLPMLAFANVENEKVKIKEIKTWVKENSPSSTCLDEYLQRRKQISWQLGLAPLSVAGSVVGGVYGGGLLGHGTFLLTGQPNEGFTDLAYTVGGAAVGAFAGAAVGVTSGTITTINFFNNRSIIKGIYESRTNSENDDSSENLHQKYNKKFPEDNLSFQVFKDQLTDLDLTGKLCDGSLVAPKRFKKGRKLKQRLATQTEIFKRIHEDFVKEDIIR